MGNCVEALIWEATEVIRRFKRTSVLTRLKRFFAGYRSTRTPWNEPSPRVSR
ncbi:hypothetical protein WN55_08197 [Dufourea novaeangliae]|uniref:Uncharacterized protein n=1 Tax=Dufourea novaeangliae TaxID=178035 RepID=A0A154P759_DUFNO|nr:hypothetical protein WN55_08197 [Dufourea novaeangliae]